MMIFVLMKRIPLFLLLSIVLCIITARPLKAQTSIIPDIDEGYLKKLIDTAKAHYPRVKSYQNHINIAENNISKARASYLDVFTFSYVYQPHSATFVPTTDATTGTTTTTGSNYSYFNGIQAGLFFNLGNYLQKPYAVKVAKQELIVAHNDQEEYFITLTTEVKKRYYQYVLRIAELKLQTTSAQDAEDIVKSMRHKFEKGEETYDNYNKAQVTYSDRVQTRIQAEASLLTARADLEELVGQKLENIK